MRVRVGPQTFSVRYIHPDEPSAEEDFGSFHPRTGIELAIDQAPPMMASTLLHEIIHAIWYVNGLPETVDEEAACSRLEGPLLEFICDNPTLINQLRAAVKGSPLKGVGKPKE